MEKSSSEESAIHRSPSVDSCDSDFARASSSGRPFGGRGFTAGAFYGSTGRKQPATDNKEGTKPSTSKSSKYVVFYLDLSFVFLLEFKKCNMASGFLCCLKYMMFIFNLIFWVSDILFCFFIQPVFISASSGAPDAARACVCIHLSVKHVVRQVRMHVPVSECLAGLTVHFSPLHQVDSAMCCHL